MSNNKTKRWRIIIDGSHYLYNSKWRMLWFLATQKFYPENTCEVYWTAKKRAGDFVRDVATNTGPR